MCSGSCRLPGAGGGGALALQLLVADDADDLRVAIAAPAIEARVRGQHASDEGVDAFARHPRVVRRDANLAAVDRLAARDAQRPVGHRVVARDYRHRVLVEDLGQQPLRHGVGGWRDLAHLERHAVAGRQLGNQPLEDLQLGLQRRRHRIAARHRCVCEGVGHGESEIGLGSSTPGCLPSDAVHLSGRQGRPRYLALSALPTSRAVMSTIWIMRS